MTDTTRSARGANATPPATSSPATSGAPPAIAIGKIVRSESHVRYTCQVFGPGETPAPPEPEEYAFGSFVRVPLRIHPARPNVADVAQLAPAVPGQTRAGSPSDALIPRNGGHVGHSGRPLDMGEVGSGANSWAVGLIYDTILLNPAFGALGPRLSNDEQVTLFSPDYLSERAVLVSILLLGSISGVGLSRISHGVPPVAPDLGAVVSAMNDAEVRAFHHFADDCPPGGARPYLHMGYLPHAVAQDHPLLQIAMLHTVERLERLCPENAALLAIVKRNFAWRLKVQATG
jgi:hypothetical protein